MRFSAVTEGPESAVSLPLYIAMGARLAEFRTEGGWTPEAFAIASDVPAADILLYEAGTLIPIGRLWRFAEVLQVSITAFFTHGRPVGSTETATSPQIDEGLALMAAFRAIDDPHLRAVLIDIADYFARRGRQD